MFDKTQTKTFSKHPYYETRRAETERERREGKARRVYCVKLSQKTTAILQNVKN